MPVHVMLGCVILTELLYNNPAATKSSRSMLRCKLCGRRHPVVCVAQPHLLSPPPTAGQPCATHPGRSTFPNVRRPMTAISSTVSTALVRATSAQLRFGGHANSTGSSTGAPVGSSGGSTGAAVDVLLPLMGAAVSAAGFVDSLVGEACATTTTRRPAACMERDPDVQHPNSVWPAPMNSRATMHLYFSKDNPPACKAPSCPLLTMLQARARNLACIITISATSAALSAT